MTLTFEDILKKIEDNQPFSFARYGDGEWNCILTPDENKGNCDGHKYFTTLSLALKGILLSKPKYYLGMQNHALRMNGEAINNFLDNNDLSDIPWVNSDCFHKASIHGEFYKFFDVIKDKKVLMIAPKYLEQLKLHEIFISIPEQDCWLDRKTIISTVKTYLTNDNWIVLFCASMAANVFVDELYSWNNKHTYLDMGSVFDPLVGKSTRSYHDKIIERDYGKNIF